MPEYEATLVVTFDADDPGKAREFAEKIVGDFFHREQVIETDCTVEEKEDGL